MSDGTILGVLDELLVLDGERLSDRTLNIEQIGSVYATVMGFTGETMKGPARALRRDMPRHYSNWNSVEVRFSRWSHLGACDAAFETLASRGPAADDTHAIVSTIVRAH